MNIQSAVFDNPILVKHVRSRLRRQHLIPSVIAVVLLCLCITWGESISHGVKDNTGFICLLVVQAVLLFLAGTAQVATSVGHAKENGMLDFHRISPQSPMLVTLGFVLGAPIREYILFACTLPFALFFIAQGHPTPDAYGLILVVLVTTTVFYHLLGALAGVLTARGAPVVSVVLLVAVNLFGGFRSGLDSFTITPTCMWTLGHVFQPSEQPQFFGVPTAPVLLALLHQFLLGSFVVIALVRKMRQDRAYLFPKAITVLLHAALALLVLGDVWPSSTHRYYGIEAFPATSYAVFLAALLLATAVTPAVGDFVTGIRRAQKFGRERPSLWSDLSPNWLPLVVMSGAAFLAVVIAASAPSREIASPSAGPGCAITVACAILFFGSARQYFNLKFGKSSTPYFALLLFITWFLPIIAGMLASNSGLSREFYLTLSSISPLFGIGVFGSGPDNVSYTASFVVAIGSSLCLAVVFLALRIRAEREAATLALQLPGGGDRKTSLR